MALRLASYAAALAGTFALAGSLFAQVPAVAAPVQPLQAIPYSPSLDLTSLDRSVDPCQDFYAFTCGGWKKNNPIPSDQAAWSVYAKLGQENEQFLWGILEDDAKATNRTPVQQKVGDYFAACMNTSAIDARGFVPIQPALDRIDGLQTRAGIDAAILKLHHDLAGSYFFNAGVGQDANDASLEIVEVYAGGLGLPDRDYYLKADPRSIKLREQYVAYVGHLLSLTGEPADRAASDAAAILTIETALAKASLTRVDRRDPHKTYHFLTVADLQQLTPAIDWNQYFAIEGAPGVTKLNVSEPEFMKAVQSELANEPVENLRAYLRFHMLTSAAPYLSAPFREANFDFFSRTLRGVPSMPPRWKTCTQQVDNVLGEALGQEFVRRTFSPDMKAKTQRMTEQIETAMGQEIQNLDWMSPATKQEALRKLHAIRNKIGYPDQWRDYTCA